MIRLTRVTGIIFVASYNRFGLLYEKRAKGTTNHLLAIYIVALTDQYDIKLSKDIFPLGELAKLLARCS